MPTARKPKHTPSTKAEQPDYTQSSLFGTDYVSLYGLEMNIDVGPAYDIPLNMITNEEEHAMSQNVHTQLVAITGRHAMNKLANECIGDIGTMTSLKSSHLIENIEQIETKTRANRRKGQLEEVNSRVASYTTGLMLQANAMMGRAMIEECTAPIHVEPSDPSPAPKRKGFFPALGEVLFGEKE